MFGWGVDWIGDVGLAAACLGRVLAAAAPSLSAPPFLEGSLLRLTEPKPHCRIKGDEHMLEEGPFGLVRGMGV